MNKKNIFLTMMLAAFIGALPLMINSTHTGEFESPKSQISYVVAPPSVPAEATFADDVINLSRYDLRERMDRELMSFTYMHSTTMLMIKRANRYFPMVEPILKENGIPDDFKYLMVIESNLNILARSPAGAAGLWQFMQSTAREHGLEVNKNIDERYNITKATQAACKYLKESYALYGDWLTVAAAYNAGKGRISGQLKQQMVEKATDLWLVEETSRYMFRLMAAKMIFHDPERFGFMLKREQLYPPIPYEKVTVKKQIDNLATYAQQHGITYAQLKDANPWLRDTFLENRTGRTYVLHIPKKEGLSYNPQKIVPHNSRWVID
ncbi:lytic transglycosylase domain-containing protein [Bacteroides sp. 214]|uniref:lytic transglycosylase domain-containing protein n=1 Tax=Bacteroides sp. 214 TaxID=2302935 RepID=UPI0013D77DBD|nr:lytic transglycosylase domain-containing protein [Bacteroides sp. 214]NDW13325.1 lytic transglycosylase domain-containing protein [Bacteroides sp. 214]